MLNLKEMLLSLNIRQKVLVICPFFAVLIYVYIFDHHYDAEYYHYQQIRWNEEFAVVPGLGNLEDRFGFNSNYLLLSAIFTFRFMFGDTEALYLLQSLFYVLFFSWGLIKLFISKYNIHYIILLTFLVLIIFTYGYMLGSSSTDIFPILFILYYAARTIENPQWIYQCLLLACLLPVVLVTFKLSTATFCLTTLIIMIYIVRQKKYKEFYYIVAFSVMIITFWCIRNVIISGYLVYPVYQIDMFSFDWKVTNAITKEQNLYITEWGKRIFLFEYDMFLNLMKERNCSVRAWNSFINFTLLAAIVISFFPIIYKAIRGKANNTLLTIYFILILCLVIGLIKGPDFRFNYGYILGCFLLAANAILNVNTHPVKYGKYMVTIILVCLYMVAINKFISASKRIGMKFGTKMDFLALYHHRSSKNIGSFEEYKMGDFIIYVTVSEKDGRNFDLLPAVSKGGYLFGESNKMQSIQTIENRGNSLQNGFRTKREYIYILNRLN